MPMSKGTASVISAAIAAVAAVGAAWITARGGYISFPNPHLERQVSELRAKLDNRSGLAGDFEWQWAGDNWLGSVTFQTLAGGGITARTQMRVVKADPHNLRVFRDAVAFLSAADGSATVGQDGTITVHLPVTVTPEYQKSHHADKAVIIDAELKPVDAFAGRVRYLGDNTTGDVILVRYKSDVRKW